MVAGQRQLGGRQEASDGMRGGGRMEPAMRTKIAEQCFCVIALSSVLIRMVISALAGWLS